MPFSSVHEVEDVLEDEVLEVGEVHAREEFQHSHEECPLFPHEEHHFVHLGEEDFVHLGEEDLDLQHGSTSAREGVCMNDPPAP